MPTNRPKRYVVPYIDDGSLPKIFEWFEGITTSQTALGEWMGQPVLYEEALTWTEAKAELRQDLERERRDLDEHLAKWANATPKLAVRPDDA